MSGTRTLEAPRGLDTMDADDLALMKAMQDETEPPPGTVIPEPVVTREAPAAAPEPSDPGGDLEIDLPEDTPTPTARERTQMVPHAQFHAAREEAKAAKAALKKAEEDRAADATARAAAEQEALVEKTRNKERLDLLLALAQQPAAAPTPAPVADAPVAEAPLPDVNTDPIGHFTEAFRRSEGAREADRAILRGFQEQQNQQRALSELRNWGAAQELAFKEKEPSFDAAMDHLRKSRDAELRAIGITDPAVRATTINKDITDIALKARQDAQLDPSANFAERLYQTSVLRGFQKAPTPPPVPTPAADPIIPPLDAAPTAAARAERLEAGRDNATTIGSLGTAPPVRMSVEKILALPDDQFQAVYERMKAAGTLQELMGS